MNYSNLYFGVSALYLLLIIFSFFKNKRGKIIFCGRSRFKLLLLGFLIFILIFMFLCNNSAKCNSTYCIFFMGFIPFLILYYCFHLITKTFEGFKKLLQGKHFDELLSIFFLIPFVPTFLSILQTVTTGDIILKIQANETQIFIVTMFLILDLLSSFFEENQ